MAISTMQLNEIQRDIDQVSRGGLAACAAPSSTTYVDPAAVAGDLFGVDFKLKSRDQLLAQLQQLFPNPESESDSGPATMLPSGASGAPAQPRFLGDFAPAYFAATVLQQQLSVFTGMDPARPVSNAACDYRPLQPLIMNEANALVRELGQQTRLPDSVSSRLSILCGYDPTIKVPPPVTAETMGGLICSFKTRRGVEADPGKSCSVDDEAVLGAFLNVVSAADTLVQSWHRVKESNGGRYFSVAAPIVTRTLGSMVNVLRKLQHAIPSTTWMTSQVPGGTPTFAWDLYQWIYRYVSEGALRDLEAGKDGLAVVKKNLSAMKARFDAAFLSPSAGEAVRLKNPCGGIAAAFTTTDAGDLLTNLSCLMKDVLDVAQEFASEDDCDKRFVQQPAV